MSGSKMRTISRTSTEAASARGGRGRAGFVAVLVAGVLALLAATPPAQAATSGGGAVARYVMLGDSYSSGEGLDSYYVGTDDAVGGVCHRSIKAYGPLLAAKLTADGKIGLGQWVSGSCSGELIPNLYVGSLNDNSPNPTPQMNLLTADTRFVTITIGGNDARFASALSACMVGVDKGTGAYVYPLGSSTKCANVLAQASDYVSGTGPLQLAASLGRAYRTILAKAPFARLTVLTYPTLFPSEYTGKTLDGQKFCETAAIFSLGMGALRDQDVQAFVKLEAALNSKVASTVLGLRNQGLASRISTVRLDAGELAGHTVSCGDGGRATPYINGVRFAGTNVSSGGISKASFHPNEEGQRRFAEVVHATGMPFAKPLALSTSGATSFEAGGSTAIGLSASSGNPIWTPSIDAPNPTASYSFGIANLSPGLEPIGSKASWVFKAAQPGTYKFTAVVTDAQGTRVEKVVTLKVIPKISGLRNTVLRLGTSSATHFIDGAGTRHAIITGGVFNCLTAWKGYTVVDGATQAQLDAFPSGPAATCTVPEAANKILRVGSTTTTFLVDAGGVRHSIPTGGVFSCLTAWKGTPVLSVNQAQIESFATGPNATCSVPEAANKVLRLGSSVSTWYVDAGGTRHPIPTGGVFNCFTAWKGTPVLSVNQAQLDTFALGANATCTVPEAVNKIIRSSTNASWFVDGGGVRHPIPTAAVYNCLTLWRSIGVIDNVSQAQVDTFAEGAPQTCTPSNAANKVIRQSNSASWFVDSGGAKHPIQSGGVYNCLTAWQGKAVLDVTPAQADSYPTGSVQTCTVPQAANKVLRQSTSASYLVDAAGTRHPIASGGVFNCLTAWRGYGLLDGLTQAQVDTFANGAPATCTVPEVYGAIIRDGTTKASWLVDGAGVRHPIQTGGVYLCFTRWKAVAVWDGLSSAQVSTFADGASATCSVPEANNTLLRVGATNASYYVDGGGTKHPIQSGGVYLCFRNWKGLALYDNLAQDDVDAFATGGAATCSVPEAYNTVIRETTTNTAYFLDGNGTRHHILEGATYNCLIKIYPLYHDLTWDHINTFAEGSAQPARTC